MPKTHSIHAFMFPFRWDYIPYDSNFLGQNIPKESISYSERTRLRDFDRVFEKGKTLKRTIFNIEKKREKYNEYTYFHAFARKALYDIGSANMDKQAVLYYELNGKEEDYYQIEVLNRATYSLKLTSVCLHVYNTGVGVLTFNLENNAYKNPEDILHINEFGRRMYPQYMYGAEGIVATKGTFLANKISGKIAGIVFNEDFSQYSTENIQTESTFLAPDFIKKFFGYKKKNEKEDEKEGDEQVSFVFRKKHEKKGKIRISLVTDDRMFVMCYYKNAILSNSMANKQQVRDAFEYELNTSWYAFLFGDKNKNDITIKNDNMQIEHIKKHTYARWVDHYEKSNHHYNSSLFGMTRDSFVCLGDWDLLQIHMQTMYYQMSVLCLVQRASVLRFEYEVSNIAQVLDSAGDINSRIKDLYKNYIEFINKIYFREITSQIQGIEMYNQFQEVMNLEKEVTSLDGEIQELHTYVSMDEQGKLSKIATWFLPAGAVIGLMGISASILASNMKLGAPLDWNVLGWIGIAVCFSGLMAFTISKLINSKFLK